MSSSDDASLSSSISSAFELEDAVDVFVGEWDGDGDVTGEEAIVDLAASSIHSVSDNEDWDAERTAENNAVLERMEAELFGEAISETVGDEGGQAAREAAQWRSRFPYLRIRGRAPAGQQEADAWEMVRVPDADDRQDAVAADDDDPFPESPMAFRARRLAVQGVPMRILDEPPLACQDEHEEVLAEDGVFEEVLAIDYDIDGAAVDPRPERRERRMARAGMPPVSPRACMHDELVSRLFDALWRELIPTLAGIEEPVAEIVGARQAVVHGRASTSWSSHTGGYSSTGTGEREDDADGGRTGELAVAGGVVGRAVTHGDAGGGDFHAGNDLRRPRLHPAPAIPSRRSFGDADDSLTVGGSGLGGQQGSTRQSFHSRADDVLLARPRGHVVTGVASAHVPAVGGSGQLGGGDDGGFLIRSFSIKDRSKDGDVLLKRPGTAGSAGKDGHEGIGGVAAGRFLGDSLGGKTRTAAGQFQQRKPHYLQPLRQPSRGSGGGGGGGGGGDWGAELDMTVLPSRVQTAQPAVRKSDGHVPIDSAAGATTTSGTMPPKGKAIRPNHSHTNLASSSGASFSASSFPITGTLDPFAPPLKRDLSLQAHFPTSAAESARTAQRRQQR